jgi:hypothetical protein
MFLKLEEQFPEKRGLTPQGKYSLGLFHTIINKNRNRKEALICCYDTGVSNKHYDYPIYTNVSLSFCQGPFN